MNLELMTTLAAIEPWWTGQQAGLFGGIAGSVYGGVGGGVIGGVAIPLLVRRGRHKSVALGLMGGFALIGLAGLILGLIALLSGQPFMVWFLPVQLGGVMGILGVVLMLTLAAQYRRLEERGLEAALISGEKQGSAARRFHPGVFSATAVGVALGLTLLAAGVALMFMDTATPPAQPGVAESAPG